ncbi:MAG: hypothetical protein GY938_10190 [Ketobacter sp.]|nr:hypothetical protein [Ketobacter sp.]
MNNLQCINVIISTEKTNHLFLRFIHCPILHSRRNELLILSCHCEYIFVLLDQLSKLNRHLLSGWAMAFRCIKSKISPLQNNSEHWQHELKHNLLIGSPSQTFIQFVASTLNITALERGYKQFDQFINEISDIILKNLMHIITEFIFLRSN